MLKPEQIAELQVLVQDLREDAKYLDELGKIVFGEDASKTKRKDFRQLRGLLNSAANNVEAFLKKYR